MKAITIQNNLSPKLHQKNVIWPKQNVFDELDIKKATPTYKLINLSKKITKLNIVISAQENLRKNTKQNFKYF